MSDNAAPKLDPISLLKIYGNIEFEWDLIADTMDWQGPMNKLISPDIPLTTGSSYNNCLDPKNFWRRMRDISDGAQKDHTYESHYILSLKDHQIAHVHEQGQIIYKNDEPSYIEGIVRIDDELPKLSENLSGYDELTGFQSKEVLYETLASLLVQAQESNVPGAYLAVSLDQLGYLNCKYGVKVVSEIIKNAAEKLREAIRFDDSIGRISGPGIGVILKSCDRWGIVRASERLSKSVEGQSVKTSAGNINVRASAGGIIFPEKNLTADAVMHKAEKCLFEAQNIAGMGAAWTPYSSKVVQELVRPDEKVAGVSRASDAKSSKRKPKKTKKG